jgi:hypothetical protein
MNSGARHDRQAQTTILGGAECKELDNVSRIKGLTTLITEYLSQLDDELTNSSNLPLQMNDVLKLNLIPCVGASMLVIIKVAVALLRGPL